MGLKFPCTVDDASGRPNEALNEAKATGRNRVLRAKLIPASSA